MKINQELVDSISGSIKINKVRFSNDSGFSIDKVITLHKVDDNGSIHIRAKLYHTDVEATTKITKVEVVDIENRVIASGAVDLTVVKENDSNKDIEYNVVLAVSPATDIQVELGNDLDVENFATKAEVEKTYATKTEVNELSEKVTNANVKKADIIDINLPKKLITTYYTRTLYQMGVLKDYIVSKYTPHIRKDLVTLTLDGNTLTYSVTFEDQSKIEKTIEFVELPTQEYVKYLPTNIKEQEVQGNIEIVLENENDNLTSALSLVENKQAILNTLDEETRNSILSKMSIDDIKICFTNTNTSIDKKISLWKELNLMETVKNKLIVFLYEMSFTKNIITGSEDDLLNIQDSKTYLKLKYLDDSVKIKVKGFDIEVKGLYYDKDSNEISLDRVTLPDANSPFDALVINGENIVKQTTIEKLNGAFSIGKLPENTVNKDTIVRVVQGEAKSLDINVLEANETM